jgi:hypothetical protein
LHSTAPGRNWCRFIFLKKGENEATPFQLLFTNFRFNFLLPLPPRFARLGNSTSSHLVQELSDLLLGQARQASLWGQTRQAFFWR